VKQYALFRPGSNAHAPCDGCHEHEKRFYEPPGEFCLTCHESVNPMKKGESPLRAYPQAHNTAQLVASFNHRQHLEPMSSGEQLACADCHQVRSPDDAYATFPKHDACAKCHAEKVGPKMQECKGCHADDGPGLGRRFLVHLANDVRFTHGRHQVAPTGQRVECTYCHESEPTSERTSDLRMPEMRVCSSCHDSNLTPPEKRMTNCGLCHENDRTSEPLPDTHAVRASRPAKRRSARRCGDHPGDVRRPAPKPSFSFLDLPRVTRLTATTTAAVVSAGVFDKPKPARSTARVPQSHTPAFRTRHAKAAESEGALCSYCHLGTSGSTRDACQDCHAVSRPRSHTLRWRSSGHGRAAARDSAACATCHEIDYCTECHNVAPRNHFPLARFRERHFRAARANIRSCLTCHTFESTCSRCHGLDLSDPASSGLRGTP
jgi:predicted CXXCH cytochrome family protein